MATLSLGLVGLLIAFRSPGTEVRSLTVAPGTWIPVNAQGQMVWPPNVPPVGLFNQGQPVCRVQTASGLALGQSPPSLAHCIGSVPGAAVTSSWPPPFEVLANYPPIHLVNPQSVDGQLFLKVATSPTDSAYVCKSDGYGGPFGVVSTQSNPLACMMGRSLVAPGQQVVPHARFYFMAF